MKTFSICFKEVVCGELVSVDNKTVQGSKNYSLQDIWNLYLETSLGIRSLTVVNCKKLPMCCKSCFGNNLSKCQISEMSSEIV
jgi:hypothetical protein